jgi:hypothetical protein
MDFEDTACLDSASGDTCTTVNGYDADYGTALAGLLSGFTIGDGTVGDNAEMNMLDTDDCGAAVDKTTTDFHFLATSGANSTFVTIIAIKIAGDQGFQLDWKQSTEEMRFNCGEHPTWVTGGAITGLAADVPYHIRMDFDAANMDCTW